MTAWRETTSQIFRDAGDVGGDIQAGESYCRSYVFGPIEGRYLVVDEFTYPTFIEVPETDARHGKFGVDEQTSYTICTDPDDPGSTEVDSNVIYGEGDARIFETAEDAGRGAYRLLWRSGAQNFSHYNPTDELKAGRLAR